MSPRFGPAPAAPDAERPVYPTWIRSRRTAAFWSLAVAMVVLGLAVARFWPPGLTFALLAIPFLYIAGVLTLTSHRLGSRGGDFQSKIHQLLINSVGSNGRLLDVGCGSGQLLIRFESWLQATTSGSTTGEMTWNTHAQAVRNAALENVRGLQFLNGSASRLPFADGDFARVVSSVTFHEVRDVDDKTVSIAEALRVLKRGGTFAFIDLFDDPRLYGRIGTAPVAVRLARRFTDRLRQLRVRTAA